MTGHALEVGRPVGHPRHVRPPARFPDLVERLDPEADFNYRHFRMRHMIAELIRSGSPPGQPAPDFTLPTTDGTELALSQLRGRPVLVHFVSYTCPVTRGAVMPMRLLYERYGDQLSFVAVDDVAGSVQRAYGGLAAAVYLLDANGRVAYCALWGQSPRLTEAIGRLLTAPESPATPGRRAVDRRPHLGAAFVAGQRGPLRGGVRSIIDLELGFPGATFLMTTGWLLRPILRPLVQRTTPVPNYARVTMLAFLAGLVARKRASRRAPGTVRTHGSGRLPAPLTSRAIPA